MIGVILVVLFTLLIMCASYSAFILASKISEDEEKKK